MALSQPTRLLSPEEIAVRAGQQVPFIRLPDRQAVFAERALRLRQLSAGHAMRDYLLFAAELAQVQQQALAAYLEVMPAVALPTVQQADAAARAGQPLLPAASWPRDAVWRTQLRKMLDTLLPRLAGTPAHAVVQGLRDASDDHLEHQADRLLGERMFGLDLGTAPLIAAGLQTYFAHLVIAIGQARGADRLAPFGRTDDATHCPCCGSRPTASITRIGADAGGVRYLHCALCQAQWHMVRIKCTHCQSTKGIGYQGAAPADGGTDHAGAASKDAVQVETCDSCNHYLKIVHMERDHHVEPVADDLASLTLDLLVADTGRQRHGVNLLLLFGEPDGAAAAASSSTAG